MNCKIIKKDGTLQDFEANKIKIAISKSAERVSVKFSDNDLQNIVNTVIELIKQNNPYYETEEVRVSIKDMHSYVEGALERSFPLVAKSYRDYRNYKIDFANILDKVYSKSQAIMYRGDKENSNTDSALVSTKRSLIYNYLNKEL